MARFSTLPIDAQLAFADVGDADLGDLAAAVERAQAALDALPQGDALRVKLMITFKHILTFVRFRQAQDHPRPAQALFGAAGLQHPMGVQRRQYHHPDRAAWPSPPCRSAKRWASSSPPWHRPRAYCSHAAIVTAVGLQ